MIVSCPSCQRNYVVADEQIAGKQFRARCKSCGVEFRLDGSPTPETPVEANQEPAKYMSATEAYLALQSAPPPSAGAWSVRLSQSDTRRMSTDEIVEALSKGTISANVFVWKSGMPKWLRVSDVAELVTAAGTPTSRLSQAGVTAENNATPSEAASGTSKPAPPNRGSSPIRGSRPPPPIVGAAISARSGQTMPPPPMVHGLGPSHGDAKGPVIAASLVTSTQTDAGGVRRSTPAPQGVETLDIPVEFDEARAIGPDAATTPQSTMNRSVVDAALPTNATPATGSPGSPAASALGITPVAGVAAVVAGNAEAPAAVGEVQLPPLKSASSAEFSGAASPSASSNWPVHQKLAGDAKSASNSRQTEVAPSTPPPEPEKVKRFARATAAIGAVGLVVILGGVAGAVYVMKSTSGHVTQVPAAVVARQPLAATPAAPVASTPVAPAAGVIDVDSVAASNAGASKSKSSLGAEHVALGAAKSVSNAASLPKTRAHKASVAEFPSSPATVEPNANPSNAVAPTSAGAPFNREVALAVLGLAASRAPSCKRPDGPTGAAKVYVTFDPSGTVVNANVLGAPIAGSAVAQCVVNLFRRVKVPPFSGERASVSRDFSIAP